MVLISSLWFGIGKLWFLITRKCTRLTSKSCRDELIFERTLPQTAKQVGKESGSCDPKDHERSTDVYPRTDGHVFVGFYLSNWPIIMLKTQRKRRVYVAPQKSQIPFATSAASPLFFLPPCGRRAMVVMRTTCGSNSLKSVGLLFQGWFWNTLHPQGT